jgi:hypothetical protein
MDWDQQVKLLHSNPDIKHYFINSNINLVQFTQDYIKVNNILHSKKESYSASELSQLIHTIQTQHDDKLSELSLLIKTMHTHNADKISELQFIQNQQEPRISEISNILKCIQLEFINFKSQLDNSIRNVTNTEIKDFITNINSPDQSNLFDKLSNFNSQNVLEFNKMFDKILNINSQNLTEFDRKTLNIIQNMQNSFNSSLDSHFITNKINDSHEILTSLHNKFNSNSSKKGEFAENILFSNLVKAFPDSDVLLTRFESDAADIQIKKDNRPLILIDSKHIESKNVPKLDLDKFHDNCKLNNASGILCNAFGGIANKKNFEIDIIDKHIFVYIWNHEFDSTLFQIATRIIYNIHDIIKEQKTDKIHIDQILYKKLKLEYNFFLQNFQQHLSIIKSNIKSLEQLSLNQLEQFFKRTNFNSDDKPFNCEMCGTGFLLEKYLKDHVKKTHNIDVLPSKRGRKKKTTPSDDNLHESPTKKEAIPEQECQEQAKDNSEHDPDPEPDNPNIIRF